MPEARPDTATLFANLPFIVLFSQPIAASIQLSVAAGTVMPFLLVSYLGNFISTAITATLLSVAFRTLTGFDGRTNQLAGADHE